MLKKNGYQCVLLKYCSFLSKKESKSAGKYRAAFIKKWKTKRIKWAQINGGGGGATPNQPVLKYLDCNENVSKLNIHMKFLIYSSTLVFLCFVGFLESGTSCSKGQYSTRKVFKFRLRGKMPIFKMCLWFALNIEKRIWTWAPVRVLNWFPTPTNNIRHKNWAKEMCAFGNWKWLKGQCHENFVLTETVGF